MRATAAHEREEEYLFEFSEVFRQGRYLPYRCEVLQCSFCPELVKWPLPVPHTPPPNLAGTILAFALPAGTDRSGL